jgi:hypothetical protein
VAVTVVVEVAVPVVVVDEYVVEELEQSKRCV